jgi:lipid A 3-O-deacylase
MAMTSVLPRICPIASPLLRRAAALVIAPALAAIPAARAADAPADAPAAVARAPASAWSPTGAFAQLGVAREAVAETLGVTWNLRSHGLRAGWSVHVEASLSRWHNRGGYPSDHGVLTQLGVIPVVRYEFAQGSSPWFVEGGIGVTFTSSVYRAGDKRFSTAFNFGDHLGVGRAFGAAREHELVLRIAHFSNAGIKRPNPGQQFVQIRYQRLFG